MATRGGGLQQGGLSAALTGVGRDDDVDALTPTSRSIVSDVLRRNSRRFANGGSVSEDIIADVMPDPIGAATSSLSQARERLTALQEKREARRSTDRWLALAQGMLAPTRTGGFGESVSQSAGQLGKVGAAERKEDIQLAKVEAALGPSSAQRLFDDLSQHLSPEDLKLAREIKLGLKPRRVGNAAITAMLEDYTKALGESMASVGEAKKFGELKGAARSREIDKGYDTIKAINANVLNLDKAYDQLAGGASTGFIMDMLPSLRASSIKLDQIQKELGLDIIGATTFGALSKGELDLALATGIPTTLEPEELMEWLKDKKIAQLKLRDYYIAQIDHLDTGGSIASWIRKMERGAPPTPTGGGATGAPSLTELSEEDLDRQIEEAQAAAAAAQGI